MEQEEVAFTGEQRGKHIFNRMAIVKQWPSKHISVVSNTHAIVEGPWKPVFLCGVCQEDQLVVIGRSVGRSVS